MKGLKIHLAYDIYYFCHFNLYNLFFYRFNSLYLSFCISMLYLFSFYLFFIRLFFSLIGDVIQHVDSLTMRDVFFDINNE